MRHLLCEACGRGQKLVAGERLALEATKLEPAEYERVVWGTARLPSPAQRVIHINDVPFPLEPGEYTCDLCSAGIKPGDRCCAQTVWLEGQKPAGPWEQEFMQGIEK
jgi:hypothetical protein